MGDPSVLQMCFKGISSTVQTFSKGGRIQDCSGLTKYISVLVVLLLLVMMITKQILRLVWLG